MTTYCVIYRQTEWRKFYIEAESLADVRGKIEEMEGEGGDGLEAGEFVDAEDQEVVSILDEKGQEIWRAGSGEGPPYDAATRTGMYDREG